MQFDTIPSAHTVLVARLCGWDVGAVCRWDSYLSACVVSELSVEERTTLSKYRLNVTYKALFGSRLKSFHFNIRSIIKSVLFNLDFSCL